MTIMKLIFKFTESLQDFQKGLLALTGGKIPSKTNSDTSVKKAQKQQAKTFDRAKSR